MLMFFEDGSDLVPWLILQAIEWDIEVELRVLSNRDRI